MCLHLGSSWPLPPGSSCLQDCGSGGLHNTQSLSRLAAQAAAAAASAEESALAAAKHAALANTSAALAAAVSAAQSFNLVHARPPDPA